MRDNIQKFLLLGVLLFSVFFLHRNFALPVSQDKKSVPVSVIYTKASEEKKVSPAAPRPIPLPSFEKQTAFLSKSIVVRSDESVPALRSPESVPSETFYPTRAIPAKPDVHAEAALVADLETGENYFSFESGKRWPIASLTKLMTAAVAMKTIDMGQVITLTDIDFHPELGGSALRSGEEYTASDLLEMMLLVSSNEAAEALSNVQGRTEFVRAMNEQAFLWGLHETFYSEPTGLLSANQATPDDLRKLAAALHRFYPRIFDITRLPQATVTELRSGESKTISSINLFAGRGDFLGGKTGYIDESNGNLLSLFSHNGRPIIVVVLGTNDRFGETEKLIRWFKNDFTSHTTSR
ncbi:MAG: serine hydrolase [Patescibacteria group bacterium]